MNFGKSLCPLLLAAALFLSGCGKASAKQWASSQNTVDAVLQQQAAPTASPSPAAPELPDRPAGSAAASQGATSGARAVDVDLTVLNATMVYAEVFAMIESPQDYVGKTIKMRGEFNSYEGNPDNPDGSAYYFAVVIADATACCEQGVEFIWNGEHAFPADYPMEGTEITVTGVFATYEENGYTYGHILTDTIEV